MKLTAELMVSALEQERAAALRGSAFKVLSAHRVEHLVVLELEPQREAGKSTAIDESLEGSKAVWFEEPSGRGEVIIVNPEKGEVSLRFVQGNLPERGATVRLFPHDFITPLLELWKVAPFSDRALRVLGRSGTEPIKSPKALGPEFSVLRKRQCEAIDVPFYPLGTIIGPPGTGKTFTVGALGANLLRRLSNSRIILTGPTNVAVDTAMLSIDDWLHRVGRDDLRYTMKRIGSRFDSKKYAGRDHLLPKGLYEASVQVSLLELDEPSKTDVVRYAKWKEMVDAARAKLKADVEDVARSSRLVALTTSSIFHYFSSLKGEGVPPWHFVLADEASQITLPAALMAAGLGKNCTFIGDPNQLAPIVQSDDLHVEKLLGSTAFDVAKSARSVFLNEQSRMAVGICDVVSHTFYRDELRVCSIARQDQDWKRARSSWYVDGREVPRIVVDERAGESTWSTKYNGMIRFKSAEIIEATVNELLGSYAEIDDMLVLTPFRAQRALLKQMFRRDHTKRLRISTVHRSQGSESKIVLFDPVNAGTPFLNSDNGRRLINVAASRAQAHLIVTVGEKDLLNPWLATLVQRSRAMWANRGNYAGDFQVRLKAR